MHYHRNSKWQILIAVVFIIFSSTSFAIGFGKIKVYSYLNEILSAEIELIGVENIHQDLLIAKLANSKDFVRAGLARPFFLTKLTFEIIRYEDKTVIYISSLKPVQHPFLEFLVELSWTNGKLVKEYTVLIDPPPVENALANRPKSLRSKKALVADNIMSDSQESANVSEINLVAPLIAVQKSTIIEKQKSVTVTPPRVIPTVLVPKPAVTPATTVPQPAVHEEHLIHDNTEVEKAFGDNIEVNKSEHTTGLLGGIIAVLKDNPLFNASTIDSNKLANQSLNSRTTTQPEEKTATLKDLLAKPAQAHTDSDTFAEFNAMDATSSSKRATHKKALVGMKETIDLEHDNENNNPTYKKYAVQLILSFIMVLVSGVFIIRILRRSHVSSVSEYTVDKFALPRDAAQTSFDELYQKDLESTDFSGLHINDIDNYDTTAQDDQHAAELAEIDRAIAEIKAADQDTITIEAPVLAPTLEHAQDEVNLKIDLAKQYIDADDHPSAKNVLNEIIAIATPKQKQEIDNLLKTLTNAS